MMHRFMYVVFIFIAFCAHARTLHVGDSTIKLSQTKTTTPALHIKVDGEIWYGNMCTNFNTNSLHIKYNGTVYDVIEPFTDTTNYTYDENGRLIAANENIYLENVGKQYLCTGLFPDLNLTIQINIKMKKYTGSVIFGTLRKSDLETYRLFNYAGRIYFDINGIKDRIYGADKTFNINERYNFEIGNRYVKNLNSGYIVSSTPIKSLSYTPDESHELCVFGRKNYLPDCLLSLGSIYSLKIWNNNTLVRHFVPVPCGLQIGDFVVPSNGMWDIVEQKFYGNMGSGDFIYGVDE